MKWLLTAIAVVEFIYAGMLLKGIISPRPAPVAEQAAVERARPMAHLYAYGEGGTGLWMRGLLPTAGTWRVGDTLLLATSEARFDSAVKEARP